MMENQTEREYRELCRQADSFIEGFKSFYEEYKNGEDIKEICKARIDSNIA